MRYVTLRHSISGNWCIEAPHPVANIPQPHFLAGLRMSYATLRAAVKALNEAGYTVVPNKKEGLRYIYLNGKPLTAN
jgi:hypothetical protein